MGQPSRFISSTHPMKARTSNSKPGSSSSRPAVSRQAYNVAKAVLTPIEGAVTTNAFADDKSTGMVNPFGGTMSNINTTARTEIDYESARMTKQLEDEIMGDHRSSRKSQKSNAMEKNLHQMIDVLNNRLKTLGDVAKIRMKLCEDDINKDSQNTSKQAPRIGDDQDESIPRSLRDTKYVNSLNNNGTAVLGHLKDNLVSADGVFIDPYHLVLRTRAPTEAAKKLESNLEQSFGNLNIREMKNKKSKASNQSDKSKRTEQLKNDKKRENRQRIEKKLQMVMESFVTRSVMDTELTFELPDHAVDEPDWPVSVKWCKDDPRAERLENTDGEFNPDLLLRYSMERITLPSGRGVFVFILKQPVVQRYFVTLFWLIKVKFFEADSEEREAFLLRLLSLEYRQIVELMANRTHAEHEKDFVYKFLPFLLTNGVYFGFYYVFPGSRHIYTKGFKKTIYMQIIQIMHGIQICPISVKVSWAKLFPEDIHDDNEDNEDGGELFPVQIALKSPHIKQMVLSPVGPAGISYSTRASTAFSDNDTDDDPSPPRTKKGMLQDQDDVTTSTRRLSISSVPDKPSSAPATGGKSVTTQAQSQSQQSASLARSLQNSSSTFSQRSIADLRADELLDDPRIHRPFLRSYLAPPPEKPVNLRGGLKRQNLVERMNAQELSPAMSLFLASRSESQGLFDHHFGQLLRRTVPVQWCAAGGSDTHRRRPIQHELHNEISNKLQESEAEYHETTSLFHRKKLQAIRGLEKHMTKVLSSGSTNISRLSLDLIRRQRASRGATSPRDTPAPVLEELDMSEMAQLAQYDDDEIDRFLAEL